MKKWFLGIFAFLTIFIFSDRVSAAHDSSNTVYVNFKNEKVVSVYNQYKTLLDEVENILRTQNVYNHKWFATLQYTSSNYPLLRVVLFPSSFDNVTHAETTEAYSYCSFSARVTYDGSSYSSGVYCGSKNLQGKEYTIRLDTGGATAITNLTNDLALDSANWTGMKRNYFNNYFNATTPFDFSNGSYDLLANETIYSLPYASGGITLYNYDSSSGTSYNLSFSGKNFAHLESIPDGNIFETFISDNNSDEDDDIPEYSFEDVEPSVTLFETAEQLQSEVNYRFNNTTPNLTSGQATYNYIYNTFIPNEVFKQYGNYYVCSGGNTYTSYCYISDNPDVFTVRYGYTGSVNSPSDTYLNLFVTPTKENEVYRYAISSGSYNSDDSYYMDVFSSSSDISKYNLGSLNELNSASYIATNATYFKMKDTTYNTIKTSDGYMFNNGNIVLYKRGNSFVVNTDYKTSLTPEVNIFDQEVDDIDYFKMIFDFDVEVLKEKDNIFDYLIDFENLGSIQDDNTINENRKSEFGRPYIEYVDKDGILRILDIDFGYEDQRSTRTAWYVAQTQEIASNISSLRLILPMDETAYARYRIRFVSYIPFEVSYVFNEEVLSYYENVDLTNKYGVMFMPKLVENKSDIFSIFYTTGIESVSVYSSYNLKESPIEVYDGDLSEFKYSISYDDVNNNLFFKVNSLTPELGVVTYDTRYFTYKVVDSKYSVGSVTNPNTGENNYMDFSNINNVQVNFDSLSSIFEFIGNQLDKSSEAYMLFTNSVNVFFGTMPLDVYILIITILAVLFIGIALALGGWK